MARKLFAVVFLFAFLYVSGNCLKI